MRIIGLDLLKKLGMALVAIILGMALLQKMLAEVPGIDAGLIAALLLLSPLAYFLLKTRRKKPARRPTSRARERTRIAA